LKKVSSVYIIGAFAVSFILYRIITRKQEDNSTILTKGGVSSTTPVSGTSQTILDNISEKDAEQLKSELKK
jgi:hypothetical protein|tara:strand:+ start:6337 stop:6549 length:213 start_codon:yes stop_codon:yes gene_type:complete